MRRDAQAAAAVHRTVTQPQYNRGFMQWLVITVLRLVLQELIEMALGWLLEAIVCW